jgi:tRNA (cmo5U34)-methyltransferase
MPRGKWAFDGEVTEVFDDMLARSIPDFDAMRDAVTQLALRSLPSDGVVLDIGCSRGGAIRPLLELRDDIEAVGLEISEPMLDAARIALVDHSDRVTLRRCDLREGVPRSVSADVALSVLTLQFTPIEYRQEILGSVRRSCTGPLIMVEKVLGNSARIDRAMVALYLEMKADHGYTAEQINTKRSALEGVLVPVTAMMNEQLLAGAGYKQIDCFWRWMNFAGWIAYPEES